jgi:hypothetical protein
MRRSSWTPSIVPESDDHNIYLVMDDLGRLGRIWPEADAETTDLETVMDRKKRQISESAKPKL